MLWGLAIHNRQRCMIREALFFVDRDLFCFGRQCWRGDVVINAPPDVFGPRLSAVAPPRVLLGALLYATESIDIADFADDVGKPCAFFGQETGIL